MSLNASPDSLSRLGLDATELESRRRYFGITDADLERLGALRPVAARHIDKVVEDFYAPLLAHPGTLRFLDDPARVARLKRAQATYFLALFDGRCDLDYVADRLRVGFAHERIGLPPKWYLGAYNRYLALLRGVFRAELGLDDAERAHASLQKLVFFDMGLAIDTYIHAQLATVERHRAAVDELSTPVISVYERVLLLPIVGTVDTARARQIMEAVLQRVSDEKARVLILDIAGVALVDTQVADHLLKATAAVRLLGAATILTGISPQVARTVIELGVDISTMHTRAKLADGIELALEMLGRRVTEQR